MEEKAPFENVGISFNLNQKLISSINGKGSIKNNGEEPITKNRNNYINKKDSIKIKNESTFTFLFFFLFFFFYIQSFFLKMKEKIG